MSDKTYSVTIKNKDGVWVTNWYKYYHLDDIDWDVVKTFAIERGDLGYGYQFGQDSRNLTSTRTRTVLWEAHPD